MNYLKYYLYVSLILFLIVTTCFIIDTIKTRANPSVPQYLKPHQVPLFTWPLAVPFLNITVVYLPAYLFICCLPFMGATVIFEKIKIIKNSNIFTNNFLNNISLNWISYQAINYGSYIFANKGTNCTCLVLMLKENGLIKDIIKYF